MALVPAARLHAVAEPAIVAVAIVGAEGDVASRGPFFTASRAAAFFGADLAFSASGRPFPALARVAGLLAIAEKAVVAVGIGGALGLDALIDLFHAGFVGLAGGRPRLTLARVAGLLAIAEPAVVAVGIGGALGLDASIDLFHADFARLARGGAGHALAFVAGPHAVTEQAIAAVGIDGAPGTDALLAVFDAELAFGTGEVQSPRLAPAVVVADLTAVAEEAVVAVGIGVARGDD